MIEITIKCGCTRTMRADGSGGGRYICGCGARVTVSGLPRFTPTRCSLRRGTRICNGPKTPDAQTCQPCAVLIAKLAMADPEVVEQVGASASLRDFYRAKDAETERRRQEEQARLDSFDRKDWARQAPVVYYCELRPGIVKIGTSVQLGVRIDSFRCPESAVLAAEPGHYKLEKERHRQFAAQRIHPNREDFQLDEELRAHIAKVRSAYGDPFELVEQIRRKRVELASNPDLELDSVKVE